MAEVSLYGVLPALPLASIFGSVVSSLGLVIPRKSVSVLPVLSFNKFPAIAPAPAPTRVLVIGELVLGGDMVGF